MTTYNYSPLDPTRREIRVLKIHPGSFSDDIRVSLIHALLRREGTNPKSNHLDSHFFVDGERLVESGKEATYTALSYVWGPKADPLPVLVESAPEGRNVIFVTKSLHLALKHLRDQTRSRLMWIDAVCINQGDVSERGSQVSIMADIYKLAHGVIVWLGPEQDDSAYAIEQLQSLGAIADVDYNTQTFHPSEARQQCLYKAENILDGVRDQNAIFQLFKRQWFQRLWVRQEVRVRPQHIFVVCGFELLSWQYLRNAVYSLYLWRLEASTLFPSLEKRIVLIYRFMVVEGISLYYKDLRAAVQDLQWEDSRDVIYAMQSFLPTHERNIGISFDYSKTVPEVFEGVASQLVQNTGQLDWLCSCELSPRVTSPLPSWVPDWAQHTNTWLLTTTWHASAWISPQARLLGDSVLSTASIFVATVDQVRPLSIGNDMEKHAAADGNDIFYGAIRAIESLKPTQPLKSPHVGGANVIDVYTECIYTGLFSDRFHPPNNDYFTADKCRQTLEDIWAESGESMTEKWDSLTYPGRVAVHFAWTYCTGRSFIITGEGYIGLAPSNAEPGDKLYVILGCSQPMLLRPLGDASSSLQIVGPCYVPGVMFGEAIHGPFPGYYHPVMHDEPDTNIRINGHRSAIWDSSNDILKTDPAEILREMGIHPTRYQRAPHTLEVTRDAFEAAGVRIEDIRLV